MLTTLSHSRQETNAFTQLYQFTTQRLTFEAKRLNQELESNDDVYRLTALFRPTVDGYAFTDLSLKPKDAKPITDLRKEWYPFCDHQDNNNIYSFQCARDTDTSFCAFCSAWSTFFKVYSSTTTKIFTKDNQAWK